MHSRTRSHAQLWDFVRPSEHCSQSRQQHSIGSDTKTYETDAIARDQRTGGAVQSRVQRRDLRPARRFAACLNINGDGKRRSTVDRAPRLENCSLHRRTLQLA